MIRILCVNALNPYNFEETRIKPLWPSYLAAYSEKYLGSNVAEFKYCSTNIKKEIESFKPSIFCISSVTKNYNCAIDLASAAKVYSLPVIIGGMHISSLPSSLSDDMDIACIGEGEETFLELLKIFIDKGAFNHQDLDNIRGIAFRKGETITKTKPRPSIDSIDSIPHPKRSIVGYSKHNYLYTARGCIYKCVFCSCHKHWGNVRYASAEYIVEEILELMKNGVTAIRFADENFVYNKERLKALVKLIHKYGINKKVKFSCWCRANDVNKETVDLLKSINVVSVKFGFESGSNRILNAIKGEVTVDDNHRAIELFRNAGIQVNGDFLFGAPEETDEDIQATYDFIKNSKLNFVDINIFSPLPGTPVWDYALEKKFVSDIWMDWSRCNYKFIADKDRAIILSELLTYEQLFIWHKKFKRLRFIKALTALLFMPWLDELPGIIIKIVRNKLESSLKNIS